MNGMKKTLVKSMIIANMMITGEDLKKQVMTVKIFVKRSESGEVKGKITGHTSYRHKDKVCLFMFRLKSSLRCGRAFGYVGAR